MTTVVDPTVEEKLFDAYWEDRGADLAVEHDKQQVVLKEHQGGLAAVVIEEMSSLGQPRRGRALEALLRGYRAKLHKISEPNRG